MNENEAKAISVGIRILLKLMLPSLKAAAKNTSNPYDDAAIKLLEGLLE